MVASRAAHIQRNWATYLAAPTFTDLFAIHVATAHRYADIAHRAATAEHAGH